MIMMLILQQQSFLPDYAVEAMVGKGSIFIYHASRRESSQQLLSHSAPRSKISIARASGRASWQADYCAAMQCLLPVTFHVMATPAAGKKICVYIVFVYLAEFASSALMLLMMKKSHIVYTSRHDWQRQQWRRNIVYLSWKFLHRANLISGSSTETYHDGVKAAPKARASEKTFPTCIQV